ncbi:MAG: ZIP family metal transporter [Acidobacteriota bacterium]|nr:MAG: ZIP family metal transporter [Acidobacteriota bacterium]
MTAAWDWFVTLHPVAQALIATTGTWLVTALGAALVLFTKDVSERYLDASVGFAAGVMTAASFWSLLAPAIALAEEDYGRFSFFPALVGFLLGAVALRLTDRILPHMHPDFRTVEGVKTSWHRSTLLVLAITMHNIPEGLAVGVAFGAASLGAGDLGGAIALAIGIGLQNFPEGSAVSLPLRREGLSRRKALWYGQLSAIVEPLAGVVGAALVLSMRAVLPYALAFAAGAMIFVVAEELIPESQRRGHPHVATTGVIIGFAVMMTLDVALG